MPDRFVIILEARPQDPSPVRAEEDLPGCVRLRAFLKMAWRAWQLKCLRAQAFQTELFEGGSGI